MPATLLTPTTRGSSGEDSYLIALRFDIPSVPKSSESPYYEVIAPNCGKIVRVKVQPAGTSTDFDIEFGDVDGFVTSKIDTILKVEELDSSGVDLTGTNYYYVNRSSTEEGSFFVKITNSDSSNATGIVTVETIISRY